MKSVRLTALLPLAAVLLLSGCGDEQDDLRSWMEENSKGLKPNLKPLPPIQQVVPVNYQGASKVDPFRVAKLEPDKKGGQFAPDANRRREPLETPGSDSTDLRRRRSAGNEPEGVCQQAPDESAGLRLLLAGGDDAPLQLCRPVRASRAVRGGGNRVPGGDGVR